MKQVPSDGGHPIKSKGMHRLPVFRSLLVAVAVAGLLSARQPVRVRHAMVVSEEPLATDVGVRVLQSGGNAIDAAVAVGFALAVTHPAAGNLGGGGFMLVRLADGQVSFLDFRERAPAKASRDMYIGPDGQPTNDSIEGWRAAGVPGTVKGLELAARKWGTRPWPELVAPAVDLARNGFVLSYSEAKSMGGESRLRKFPESKRVFLNDGLPYDPGDRFVQPDLARTLGRIAREGSRDFYEGETARILAGQMALHGGLITLDDLKSYTVVERKPLQGCYRGYEILTAPPPSSGGIGILQMLGMLERSSYEKSGAGSAAAIHFVAEAMRRYFADRSAWTGRSRFLPRPSAALLDPDYLAKRRASIDPDRATPSDSARSGCRRFGQ